MRLSWLAVLLLAGCAAQPARELTLPLLRLPPAALPQGAWQQQLRFAAGNQLERRFELLLENDGRELRLAAFAAQQLAFKLAWNGVDLAQQRAAWLPAAFEAGWVLDDLSLAQGELAALEAVLPRDWSVRTADGLRELRHAGRWQVRARVAGDRLAIEHRARGYRLEINSRALTVQHD